MDVEFFAGSDGHVWYRTVDDCQQLSVRSTEIIDYMIEYISRTYPGTLRREKELFKASERNRIFFKFRIVDRFVRCNMGEDNTQRLDISGNLLNLEFVHCPLRGVCMDEGVICCPKAASAFSPAEQQVAVLYSNGCSISEIADDLNKSQSTVNNQLWKIMKKFGVKTRREIVNLCRNFNLL